MSDPIADLLIRIKNGYLAGKSQVSVPWSKILEQLAGILKNGGYLDSVTIKDDKFKKLILTLKYDQGKPALTNVRKISKPGVRRYVGYHQIPYVCNGFGMAVISTSQGLKTDREAREKKIGGEFLFEIW